MDHHNKNNILALFYQETTGQNQQKFMQHIQQCESCQEYLDTLKKTESLLNEWTDEIPLTDSFDAIMQNISPIAIRPKQLPPDFSFRPIIHIAFALAFIVISIYLAQTKISLLPFWQSLKDWWLVQAFGGFGIVIILFFCIGTFITLALTPILFLKTRQFNNAISY
ncbi:MAG: hypothetical protein MUC94_11295 [bacterium]|jgi:hypothetical protein|nr:hypothetical protein [bacterium]